MQRKHYLILSAAAALFFGCMLLIMPDKGAAFLGTELNALGLFFARSMAGAILGMAVGLWLSRNDPPSASLRAVLIIWGIFHVVGIVLTIGALSQGALPTMAIVPIVLRSLFAIGAFYFVVKMKG